MLEIISQIGIALFSASAIWFVSRKEKWKRWGYILGLISQPFWIYTTYVNEQWGIFFLTIFYTYSWCQGVYNYWILPLKNNSNSIKSCDCSSGETNFHKDIGCKECC